MKISVIKIDSLTIQEHHLEIIYSADKFQFSTKIFYHDVSFSGLMKKYSHPLIQKIVANDTPFEYIGEIEKSRLLMKRCLETGLIGKALDMFSEEILSDSRIDWDKIEDRYNYVYATEHAIPDWIFEKIKEQL